MAKYHFEIVDGFKLEDPIGQECSTDAQAKTVARKIAEQIASDLDDEADNGKVVVRDVDGEEVFTAKIERSS